jgi:hypothetical protein
MAARIYFDFLSHLSDTDGQMRESTKVEARLNDVYAEALSAYMSDRFLTNESEVIRSALGQLLLNAGYLRRDGTMLVAQSPHTPTRDGYSRSRKKAKK